LALKIAFAVKVVDAVAFKMVKMYRKIRTSTKTLNPSGI
jgi:hypothetical protein